MLIYIVAGLTTGSIFGLAAVGVVLTYKTSGIFNFAQGALASASAFLFYVLNGEHRLPWPIAGAICLIVCGPGLGLVLEWIARRLSTAELPLKVVGTVGILLAIEGGLELLFPPGPDREVQQFLPIRSLSLLGTPVQLYRLIIFAVGLVAVLALTVYLRTSRAGLAMRGVVDDAELLDISGTSPNRIRRYAWLIGSTMAAASGVLLAPLLPLDATSLTFLIVTAFGAAAIGAFTNLPLTYLGGLIIGVAQALLQRYVVNVTGLLGGLSASLPFIILFVLLLVAPRLRRPSATRNLVRNRSVAWRPPAQLRRAGLLCLALVLVTVPAFAGIHLADWTRFLGYAVVFLSLGLLVRLSGQVSLAHVAFMAIGVAALSHLVNGHHWPWLVALLVAGLVAAPIGAILAIPAIRFPGLYLALATLGFGILLQQMFYSQSYMFGSGGLGLSVPTPHLAALGVTGAKGYYYVVLVVALLVAAAVVRVNDSRLGRLLRAMGNSPAGLASCGTSINVSRVLVFALSASLAAIGGALAGGAIGTVGDTGYQPLQSLQLFVVIMITVGDVPFYAILAAAAQVLAATYISASASVSYALSAGFGLWAIIFAVTPPDSRQLPLRVRQAIDRKFSATRRDERGGVIAGPPPHPRIADRARLTPASMAGEFRVEHLTVCYGGLVAADDVSLDSVGGRITGLIGPNGAGKTTVFNACAGVVNPARGKVYLDHRGLGRLGPPARARRGLGRTFQQMELFDSLSVRENVALGCEGAFAGWNPMDHVVAGRRQRQEVAERTAEAIQLCEISEIAEQPVCNLSTGQRRLVELARCLSGRFHILLLDEPSSGLDRVETERFGKILVDVVAARKVAILLVEHDMSLVNRICDYVYVIDFGKQIFEGTVTAVGASPIVRKAYLGGSDALDDPTKAESRSPAASPHNRLSSTPNVESDIVRNDTPALAINGLNSGYGQITVVKDISFEVESGQILALLGPNGAGKTTLLRTVAGILRPTSGTVSIAGSDVTSEPPHRRAVRGLCLIPEGRGVFKTLSIRENLRLQIPPHQKATEEAVERAVALFPILGQRMSQLAGRLSGGQQQMLSLARAYITQPKIILLDEVSMGLAPLVVDEMFAAMQTIASSGVAMLIVEQYVNRAIEMADVAILMNKGIAFYHGPAADLDEATILEGYLGFDLSPAGNMSTKKPTEPLRNPVL